MRLATYSTDGSNRRACLVVDDGVVDIGTASSGRLPDSLLAVLQRQNWSSELGELLASNPEADHALDGVRLHQPIDRPGKILAAAGNYQAHITEGGGAEVDVTRRTPRIFLKPSSALIGPDDPVVLPSVSQEVDWELELAVVIGTRGKDVPVGSALDHVAGYTILNDISARSIEWGIDDREVHEWDRFFDWLAGKWVDTFAPTGPWIVTADEMPDPHALAIRLELNGELFQDASTETMLFDCADLIAFISRFTVLEPGDIITTGTPAGVGIAIGRYLQPGDVMVGTIEGVGTLRTPVVAS
jgi:2-keto-4-pentenoate hydratase/2-oxohepta-3-ene-1,7-dioic acid hydratase in catechol pathway